jgi:hypothetical protein
VANNNQAVRIRAVFIAIKIPEELHVSEANLCHTVLQFLPRVDSVIELEGPGSAFPDEYPFVPDSGPVVENFMPPDKRRTVRQHVGCGRLQNPGDTFFAHQVNQANSTGSETCENIVEYPKVLVLVIKVAKRSIHAENQIEGVGPDEITHVYPHPFDLCFGRPGL